MFLFSTLDLDLMPLNQFYILTAAIPSYVWESYIK